MPNRYSSGKRAHGFCDVCSFRYLLSELRENYVQGRPTGIKACPSCNDPDHPQNWVGRFPVSDPQALRNPRPDPALEESRVIPT